jgi:hypothetical protein
VLRDDRHKASFDDNLVGVGQRRQLPDPGGVDDQVGLAGHQPIRDLEEGVHFPRLERL